MADGDFKAGPPHSSHHSSGTKTLLRAQTNPAATQALFWGRAVKASGKALW